jgi:WD40 repeat protein
MKGCVRIWDVRQKDKAVADISPAEGQPVRDTWAVALGKDDKLLLFIDVTAFFKNKKGNSYNDEERMVCAGYENGDVKMFDLRNMSLYWETNVKNGVCSLEFDRKDIKMNKLVVSTLESTFHIFDLRTRHPTSHFASVAEKVYESVLKAKI